jgi:hypothetical protein
MGNLRYSICTCMCIINALPCVGKTTVAEASRDRPLYPKKRHFLHQQYLHGIRHLQVGEDIAHINGQ